MDWSDLLPLLGVGTSIYGAATQRNAANSAAASTRPSPYSGVTPAGFTGFDPSTGQFVASPAPNPFSNVFNALGLASLSNAGSANSAPFNGANPDLINSLVGANTASQPGSADFNDVLAKLRAVSAAQDQRDNVALDNQQFANGTMGTTGGAMRFQALKEAQNQADLQRQLAAQGIATNNAQQRFQNALTTVNQGMSSQQQQYNIGQGAYNANLNSFQQLLQQLGLGVSAGGGTAPNAAIYAASQAGNVPLALSQAANSPAFASVLQNMFASKPSSGATTPVSSEQPIIDTANQPFDWSH